MSCFRACAQSRQRSYIQELSSGAKARSAVSLLFRHFSAGWHWITNEALTSACRRRSLVWKVQQRCLSSTGWRSECGDWRQLTLR
eukprot:2685473-Rhodomonas_salina.3